MTKLALETFLPYRLNRLAAAMSQAFRAVYGPHHDLTVPEWRVLATLGQFDCLTAKAIGAHSMMHKTKVSRAVRALEERRWLVRRESVTDRREEFLSLSPFGRKAYDEIVVRALAFEAHILEASGSGRQAMLAALAGLERVFDLGEDAPAPSPNRPVRRSAGPSRP